MKPRLFWTMLLAFILVIVLGVCGMLGLFGLAIAGIWQPSNVRDSLQETQQAWSAALGDYYVAHGDSWAGVDRRLAALSAGPPPIFFSYTLVDSDGRVVASTNRGLSLGPKLPPEAPLPPGIASRGVPIEVRGKQVGTLLLRTSSGVSPDTPGVVREAPAFFWRIMRAFLVAGLGLGVVLFALAVIFARGLSRPLRRITAAAQSLAAGQLDVQVRGAALRELDELARAFNAMARSLAQADRQRRQMTADIAHELRTPLTIIKGRLEGLQDGVYTATPEQIARLLDETALLERLIEDLRLLALAEAGQLPLHPELLDPRELVEDAAAAFADQAAAQGVALRAAADDDLPPISVDPLRMAQVLSNLIANALHHTPAGGSIELRAYEAGTREPQAPKKTLSHLLRNGVATTERVGTESVRGGALHTPPVQTASNSSGLASDEEALPLSSQLLTQNNVIFQVQDTGQGIDPADLPHIFERFYRADRSRTRASGGAGLGLAIARQIVVAHGGAIWAESAPGQGTTITIALPAVAKQEAWALSR